MERIVNLKYFTVEQSPIYNTFCIYPRVDKLPIEKFTNSLLPLGARLFDLSYANYLRMCRDKFGAELYGKGNMFISYGFKEMNNAIKLAKELDERVVINL